MKRVYEKARQWPDQVILIPGAHREDPVMIVVGKTLDLTIILNHIEPDRSFGTGPICRVRFPNGEELRVLLKEGSDLAGGAS